MIQISNKSILKRKNAYLAAKQEITIDEPKLYSRNKSTNQNSIVDTDQVLINKRQTGKLEHLLSFLPLGLKSSKSVVAVLRLSGVIGKVSNVRTGLNIETLNELIEKAFEIKKLVAVCLNINSPGGSPVQSELITKRIISLSKEKKIPVYSFIEDVAASGGYWLACAGKEIYASKSSIIGSIGVISTGFGFHEAIVKLGIERRVYTEGKNKSILDPFQPAQVTDIKIIKQLQKEIHEHFIDHVKTSRIGKLTQDDDILFNGEFWSGRSAVDFGLIDGIEDMYSFIKQKFGDDIKFEYISTKQSWLKKKLGMVNHQPQEFADSIVDALEHKLIKSRFNIS